MAKGSGLSSHMFITGIVLLLAAAMLSGCQTQDSSAAKLWKAYATVLPIYASGKDTEKTKEQIYRANSLHSGAAVGAQISP
jgi:hypothetical protein